MKCPYCGQSHPDTYSFCPETGKKLESQVIVCKNPNCTFRQPLPLGTKYCPDCGHPIGAFVEENSSLTLKLSKKTAEIAFPLYDIILGQTTVKELYDANEYYKVGSYNHYGEGRTLWLTPSICALSISDQSGIYQIYSYDFNDDIEVWNQIIPLHPDIDVNQVSKYCKQHNLRHIVNIDDDVIGFLLRDGHHLLLLNTDNNLVVLKQIHQCPECGGEHIKLSKISKYDIECICESCQHSYSLLDSRETLMRCPYCGSANYDDDETDYLQFKCNDCGSSWGREIEDDE